MAKKRTLKVAAFNLTCHPHDSPEVYSELLNFAFKLRKRVRIRGDDHMVIQSLIPSKRPGYEVGRIAKYTEIDFDSPWLDTQTLEPIDDEAKSEITFPEHLRPNLVSFYFLLDVPNHKIYVETLRSGKSISPKTFEKYFRKLFSDQRILDEFGTVNVTLIQTEQSIEKLFSLPQLRSVTVTLKKPNPDDIGDLSEKLEKRLIEMHAKEMKENVAAEPQQSLKPDEELWQIAQVARKNGNVHAHGKTEDGTPVDMRSDQYPLTEGVRYDPDVHTEEDAFYHAVDRIKE